MQQENNRRLNLNNNRAFQLLFNRNSVPRPMEIQENNNNMELNIQDNQNNQNNQNNIFYSNSQFYYFDNDERVLILESEISNTKLSIGGGNKEYPLSVDATNRRIFITINRKRMYLINENSTLELWSKDFTEQFFPDVLLIFVKIPEYCLNIKKRKNQLTFEEPDSDRFSRIEVDRMSSLTRGLGNLKSGGRIKKPRQNERQRLDANLAASRISEADRLAEEEEYNDMQRMFPLFKKRKNSFGINLNRIKRYLALL